MANSINWRNEITFGSGDTIRVHQTIEEAGKTRTQIFEGIVIRIRGHQGLKSFTVRKMATGNIGVEKIFPELSPTISKIEIKKKGKVRRAVLTYLRKRLGKKATKIQDVFVKGAQKQTTTDLVIKKEKSTEYSEETKEMAKLAKVQLEEKAAREAEKAKKAKKKSKMKKKIERKEKVFVR